jgi:hypothetical protein
MPIDDLAPNLRASSIECILPDVGPELLDSIGPSVPRHEGIWDPFPFITEFSNRSRSLASSSRRSNDDPGFWRRSPWHAEQCRS